MLRSSLRCDPHDLLTFYVFNFSWCDAISILLRSSRRCDPRDLRSYKFIDMMWRGLRCWCVCNTMSLCTNALIVDSQTRSHSTWSSTGHKNFMLLKIYCYDNDVIFDHVMHCGFVKNLASIVTSTFDVIDVYVIFDASMSLLLLRSYWL